jgi:hypothetical protein
LEITGEKLPENKPIGDSNSSIVHRLDCAVIETMHTLAKDAGETFDTVRGAFIEGEEIYPKSGFRNKNHIQICVRTQENIHGYFLPETSR